MVVYFSVSIVFVAVVTLLSSSSFLLLLLLLFAIVFSCAFSLLFSCLVLLCEHSRLLLLLDVHGCFFTVIV